MAAPPPKRLVADIVVDFGSSYTRIYVRGTGLVLDEPTVVALTRRRGAAQVSAYGYAAARIDGRTPAGVDVVRPVRHGIVRDIEAGGRLLSALLRKAGAARTARRGRLLMLCPSGSTPVERRLLRQTANVAGARRVAVMEACMAAAIGAGLPVADARGALIADLGAGTCDIAIVALGGIIFARSSDVAGDAMDAAIADYLRQRDNMRIGLGAAERAKREIGVAYCERPDGAKLVVRGQDIGRGVPCETTLSEADIAESLIGPITDLYESIVQTLDYAGRAYGADIATGGIWLSGGGARLRKLDEVLARATGLPVHLVGHPPTCAVEGAGLAIDNRLAFQTAAER